jgi:hypothetical protein
MVDHYLFRVLLRDSILEGDLCIHRHDTLLFFPF